MAVFSIESIRQAAQRLSGRIVRTPLLTSAMIDEMAGRSLYLKAESLQRTGAFKYRGALNKLLTLTESERAKGIIAFSSGNHGHAVAAAAAELKCQATIVLPKNAAAIKVENCRWWGARLVFYDAQKEDREVVAAGISTDTGALIVPPFDDFEIMAGQGTAGLELCDQLASAGGTADTLVIPASGGGLSAGVVEAVKHSHPSANCYLVEPTGFEKWKLALAEGVPRKISSSAHTILDGIDGPVTGARPLEVLRRHKCIAISITEQEALHAMSVAFRTLKLVLEPAGAAGLAAVLSNKIDDLGENVAIVCSGGNVDADVFLKAVNL